MHKTVSVSVVRLPHYAGDKLPEYKTPQAAAVDLIASVTNDVVLQPGKRALIPTGLAMALPGGYEAQIRPRSGLAIKHGISLVNTPATIDSDYRGEVGIILINHGEEPFTVTRGLRIAQMIVAPCMRVEWNEVASLDETARGKGGFGSTGL